MVSTLALFPLQSVVFPGENIPLHIYEDRYRQLIEDCEASGFTFGIPAYIDQRMDFGTEVELTGIAKSYSTGAKDVICKGLRVFRIRKFNHREYGTTYANGEVEFLENIDDGEDIQREQLTAMIFELYQHLDVPPPKITAETITSFTLAHKIGLSLDQEYTLLKLVSEKDRLSFLLNHLCITIPIIQELNRTRFTIEMNGHFRNFDPLDFEDFRLTE